MQEKCDLKIPHLATKVHLAVFVDLNSALLTYRVLEVHLLFYYHIDEKFSYCTPALCLVNKPMHLQIIAIIHEFCCVLC